ncbi:MAG TPA: hypothetical protein VF407_19935, partial [Polyangiaceae bacterium]
FHAGNGDTDMYWASSSDGITWHDDNAISNMHTGTQPKLANVNGTVYLVHSGDHDNTVWISKLITSTSPWYFQQDVKLPYTSVASPSLVAYGSTLYFFGTTPITGQLWMATMDSTGAFSAATDIDGQTSHGVPGATLIPATSQFAFNAKLMIAYQSYDASDRIIVSTLSLGLRLPRQPAPTWVSSEVPGQHTDVQPAIAWYGGNVHLVFCEQSTSDLIYWSYFNGTSWSSEVTLGSERMQGSASLAALPDRLAMVHGSSIGDHHSTFPDFNTQVYAQIFQ